MHHIRWRWLTLDWWKCGCWSGEVAALTTSQTLKYIHMRPCRTNVLPEDRHWDGLYPTTNPEKRLQEDSVTSKAVPHGDIWRFHLILYISSSLQTGCSLNVWAWDLYMWTLSLLIMSARVPLQHPPTVQKTCIQNELGNAALILGVWVCVREC